VTVAPEEAMTTAQRMKAFAALPVEDQVWALVALTWDAGESCDAFLAELNRGDYDEWLELIQEAIDERSGGSKPAAEDDPLVIGNVYLIPASVRGKFGNSLVKVTRKGSRGCWKAEVTWSPTAGAVGTLLHLKPENVERLTPFVGSFCTGRTGWDDHKKATYHADCREGPGRQPQLMADGSAQCAMCDTYTASAQMEADKHQKSLDEEQRVQQLLDDARERRAGVVKGKPAVTGKPKATTEEVPIPRRRPLRRGQ
jgi:hypothetical protein